MICFAVSVFFRFIVFRFFENNEILLFILRFL